jgi:hypothetical protein
MAAGSGVTSSDSTSWGTYSDAGFAFGQGVNVLSSTDNYFKITGVQLEVGSTATDFEHRSFGEELALCQRYCYMRTGDDRDYTGYSGYSTSTTAALFPIFFPVAMRAQPSFTLSGGLRFQGGTNDSATFTSGIAITNPNTNFTGAALFVSGTSGLGAVDRPGNLQFMGDGSSILFSAEL